MLNHCTYDKIKLLHDLSKVVWFIEKHAKNDAQNAGDTKYYDTLEKCAFDISKHIEAIHNELRKQQ